MSRPSRIVVVGSSNTDMVVRSPRLPAPGETVLGGDFLMAAGGKGANQAVAAARLGGDVTLLAKVGGDVFGERALRGFEEEGIRTDLVLRDPEAASGVALILVDGDGENLISVAPGANGRLSVEEVEAARTELSTAAIVLLQLEVPLDCVRAAVSICAAAGGLVILDPAPARELDDELLAGVSILTPNEGEAERLTGIQVADSSSAHRAAAALRGRGADTVVVTLGSAGAYLLSETESALIPSPEVRAVDSTAAGDTFNGALACALARGDDLVQAIELANRAAALSVTRPGAQPSMPTPAELEAALETRPGSPSG
jgi:ribokinase